MSIKKITLNTMNLLCGLALFGCQQGVDSPQGFSLPEGDKVMGEAVFEVYHCNACHSLYSNELNKNSGIDDRTIIIGGQVTKVKTYADLVTSIINPSHKLSQQYKNSLPDTDNKSKMKNFNDVMTVSELIDLVAFLQTEYKLKPYDPTQYGYYH